MYDYLTLGAATKKYAAKEYPSPSKVWSTLNKKENELSDQAQDALWNAIKAVRPDLLPGRQEPQSQQLDPLEEVAERVGLSPVARHQREA